MRPLGLRALRRYADVLAVERVTSSGDVAVIPPLLAARIGAAALVFASFGNLITVVSPAGTNSARTIGVVLSLIMLMIAMASFMVRWDRLHPRATMALIPVAVVLVMVGNYTDPLAYVAGIYVVLIGAWVGLCQPRFTTLALTPLLAATFLLPLEARPHLGRLHSSTVIVTVVAVALGEILGLLRVRLENSRRQLLLSSQRRSEALTRHSIDVSFVFGRNNRIRFVSPSVRTRFGYSPSEIEAVPATEFLTEMVRDIHPDDIAAIVDGTFKGKSETHRYELSLRNADGEWIEVEATLHNLVDDPDVNGIVAHVRDISERRELETDLFFRAYHDDLTGLPNRAAFRERVTQDLSAGNLISVVFLDLNGFKLINDTLGHRSGDQLLKGIADRLVATAPPESLVARLGGDEFAVVLPFSLTYATIVAEGLIRTISMPLDLDSGTVTVGAKAGVAEGSPGLRAERIMEDADLAMYEAKARQGVDVVPFRSALRSALTERSEVHLALQRAVDNDEFVLRYQPQVSLTNGYWVGAEALIRWDRPGSGLVAPGGFISIAEESEVIISIGRWVLAEACREASTWPSVDGRELCISVNVSPRQFVADEFVDDVYDAIDGSGLDPTRLTIEVTESVLKTDFGLARRKLESLRSIGVRVALDDFGTGYSSLRYLLELPFSTVKIDQSFVTGATTEFNAYAVLQTINRLGHDLGLKTLIEGVETMEQARLVSSIGIDLAQGFYYGRPSEADSVQSVLAAGGPTELIEDDDVVPIRPLSWSSPSVV